MKGEKRPLRRCEVEDDKKENLNTSRYLDEH
jgi:hypothetical protein